MARKDTLNYTPTNNDHDLDNQPEPDLNHKDNWRPDSWEAHNPKLIDFRDSLDALNHTAAALMDNPQPVTGYPMVNRHQLVTDYARALNNVDFDHPPPPPERLLTAQALAHHTFEPIYNHLNSDRTSNDHPLNPLISIYREIFAQTLEASDPRDSDSIQTAYRALRDAQKYALDHSQDASNHTQTNSTSSPTTTTPACA